MFDRKLLTLSLSHVSASTRAMLRRHVEDPSDKTLDLLIYPKESYGYFIMVDLDNTEINKIPSDLLYLLRYAHIYGCYYLELDREYIPENSPLFTTYWEV